LYLDSGFVIAPAISNSLLISSQDMAFIDSIPQLSTTPIYRDMSITTDPQSSAASSSYRNVSISEPQSTTQIYTDNNMSITTDCAERTILEQVINLYKLIGRFLRQKA